MLMQWMWCHSLFNHRNQSLTAWLTDEYMGGAKYGLGNKNVDGFFLVRFVSFRFVSFRFVSFAPVFVSCCMSVCLHLSLYVYLFLHLSCLLYLTVTATTVDRMTTGTTALQKRRGPSAVSNMQFQVSSMQRDVMMT